MLGNDIGKEGAEALVDAEKDKPQLITLCGIKPEETTRNLSHESLKEGDAVLLAFDLKKNTTLVELKYAATPTRVQPKVPAAADTFVATSACSLDVNQLCGLNYCGEGTYTAEGIIKLSEALKVNATLTSLRCASSPA